MKKVYSAVKLPEETEARFKDKNIELVMHSEKTTPSEDEIIEKSKGAFAIISGVNTTITSEIIEENPDLKVIANIGAGVNNIDQDNARKNNVRLTNTPGRDSVASTAETAIALMLVASRNILKTQDLVRNNSFHGWQVTGFLGGDQVAYKNLFIVGFGNIGQKIAQMARGFDMFIQYYDIKEPSQFKEAEEKTGATFVEFEAGLKNADYVVLQMDYSDENHHFIGKNELELMKESAYLINTARGGIVDEAALVEALKESKIKGAAIDVHEEEPKMNRDLIGMENVVLTPHIGNDTYDARTEMANTAVEDALRVLDGKDPKFLVK